MRGHRKESKFEVNIANLINSKEYCGILNAKKIHSKRILVHSWIRVATSGRQSGQEVKDRASPPFIVEKKEVQVLQREMEYDCQVGAGPFSGA